MVTGRRFGPNESVFAPTRQQLDPARQRVELVMHPSGGLNAAACRDDFPGRRQSILA